MPLFNVTYEIVTEKSAEHGDAAERGFISRNARLRDALDAACSTRTSLVDGVSYIDPSSSGSYFDWITVGNGMEYLTGAYESRSIHIPHSVTAPSRLRLLRLIKGY